MTPKYVLKQALRKAMRDLRKHHVIDSPVFHIKSNRPDNSKIIYHPTFQNSDLSMAYIAERVHQICRDTDAKEVMTVSNTFLHAEDENSPPAEALIVALERSDKIHSVMQPYILSRDGKIQLKKKCWCTKNKDESGIGGTLEGLVQ